MSKRKESSTHGLTELMIGGETVHAFGLGTLPLGVDYPEPRPSEADATAVIHAAMDAGCNFFDTADTYGRDGHDHGYAEKLLARALASYPDRGKADRVRVATKGGMVRINAHSNGWRCGSVRPDRVKTLIRQSRAALGQPIFLWQLHHVDGGGKTVAQICQMTVDAMRAAHELQQEGGVVQHLGLCNATVAQIKAVLGAGIPLVSVQNNFSPFRGALTAAKPLPAARPAGKTSLLGTLQFCDQNGLCFIAYGALGGLKARRGAASPWPERLVALAADKCCSVQALALALMRRACPSLLLIVGARTTEHAKDAVQTPATIAISDAEFRAFTTWKTW